MIILSLIFSPETNAGANDMKNHLEKVEKKGKSGNLWVMCEYSKFRIESNSYFSILFDSKRVQIFEIFEYLPSPITYFNRMTPIFHLETTPSKQQNQQTLWPTKYWNSHNRNHNSLE